MAAGLVCPDCGSWYSDDRSQDIFFTEGDVCNNMSGHGKDPNQCTPENPCQGKLVPKENDEP